MVDNKLISADSHNVNALSMPIRIQMMQGELQNNTLQVYKIHFKYKNM